MGRREGYLRQRVSPTEGPEHTGSTGRRKREGGAYGKQRGGEETQKGTARTG